MESTIIKSPKREYDYTTVPPTRMVVCIECGYRKKYHAKDLCELCYANIRNRKHEKLNNLIF